MKIKRAPRKEKTPQKTGKKKSGTVLASSPELADAFSPKSKMPIELEEREEIAVLDVKAVEELLPEEETSEETETEDGGIDEEEIDPFGDKWEA